MASTNLLWQLWSRSLSTVVSEINLWYRESNTWTLWGTYAKNITMSFSHLVVSICAIGIASGNYSTNRYYVKSFLFRKLFFLTICEVRKYNFIKYLTIYNYSSFISVRIWLYRIFPFPIASWCVVPEIRDVSVFKEIILRVRKLNSRVEKARRFSLRHSADEYNARRYPHGGIAVRGSPKEARGPERSRRRNPFGRVAHAHALRVCTLPYAASLSWIVLAIS